MAVAGDLNKGLLLAHPSCGVKSIIPSIGYKSLSIGRIFQSEFFIGTFQTSIVRIADGDGLRLSGHWRRRRRFACWANELANSGSVLVIAKNSLRESSSEYAQGGIAVALSDDDEVALHEQDTLYAGDGLCDHAAVHTLVEEGPAGIQDLIGWGAEFDRDGTNTQRLPARRRTAGTGFYMRTVIRRGRRSPVRYRAKRRRSRIFGLKAIRRSPICFSQMAKPRAQWSSKSTPANCAMYGPRAVLLATGGLGRVFRETTNPDVATGDGVAMA